ncbi:MAG: hypothetical protein DRN66_03960, partial [Candidatus Nanohalarchaeota archaeon]
TILIDNNSNHNPEIGTDKVYYNANESNPIEVTLEGGNTAWFNITLIKASDNYTTTVPIDNATHMGNKTDKGFTFYLSGVNTSTDTPYATFGFIIGGWNNNWTVDGHTYIGNGEDIYNGMFNITNITNNTVNITWVRNAIIVKSIWLNDSDIAAGGQEDNSPKKIRIVNINNTDYSLLAFKNASMNTTQHEQWENNMFYVINSTGSVMGAYTKGQQMSELHDWAVLKSEIWDRKISVSNQSINGSIIYPMPWTCDNSPIYIGNFTEVSANARVATDDGGMENNQPLDNSTQYYVMVYDNTADGQIRFDKAKVCDSVDFSESDDPFGCNGPNCFPRHMEIGRENWPFMILNFNDTNKTVNLFSRKFDIDVNNTPILSLYVSAVNYDGSPVAGTINLTEIMGIDSSAFDKEEKTFGPPPMINMLGNVSGTKNVTLTNGNAYIDMGVGNLTAGPYNLKAVVNNTASLLAEVLSGEDMFFFVMGDFDKGGQSEGEGGGEEGEGPK